MLKAVKIHLGSPTPVWNLSETLRLISLIYEETRSFCKMQTFLGENTSLTSNGEDWKLEKNRVLKISFSNQKSSIVQFRTESHFGYDSNNCFKTDQQQVLSSWVSKLRRAKVNLDISLGNLCISSCNYILMVPCIFCFFNQLVIWFFLLSFMRMRECISPAELCATRLLIIDANPRNSLDLHVTHTAKKQNSGLNNSTHKRIERKRALSFFFRNSSYLENYFDSLHSCCSLFLLRCLFLVCNVIVVLVSAQILRNPHGLVDSCGRLNKQERKFEIGD